jgi:hypothetical protein
VLHPQNVALPHRSQKSANQANHGCRALAAACLLLALILPIATIYGFSQSWPQVFATMLSETQLASISDARLVAAAILALLPMALMSYALVIASRTFVGFSHGEYFTLVSVQRLRGFARAVFAAAAVGIVVPSVIGLILTVGTSAPAALSLALSSHQVILLLFAGVVWQMASVLAKAVVIADENAAFV